MGHTFSIGMRVGEVHYTEVIYLESSLSEVSHAHLVLLITAAW